MRKLKLNELNRLGVEAYKASPKQNVVVVLDNVRSMHNVGSVLRTADAFSIATVYCCGITPVPPHRDIRKTAIGAEESVDWRHSPNATELIRELKDAGFAIWALEQTDQSVAIQDLQAGTDDQIAIVLGHEVDGVSEAVIQLCDQAIEIPQFGTKHSLNVSVAAGIILYKLTELISL